ncbi:MAG: MoaD/ThiS family protein [Candidatus Poseidonia sp.]|nr:MoaD/ThiS family protein [Poseidonia sp.]
MAKDDNTVGISIMAFGPIAERLGGRQHAIEVPSGSTVREVVEGMDLREWISFGLSVAVNGHRCTMETVVEEGIELALLPPVSGG